MKTVKLTKNKTQTYKPASIKSISDFGAKTGQKVNGKLHTVLPIDQIKVKAQVRTIFENIDELAESMKEGQLLPITVTPDEEEGGYTILQGERRWLAAKKAGLTKIEVMVVDKPKSETDRIYGQLTENIQRENMKLCDLVSSISCLIEMGNSQTEIAKRLGKDRTYISRIASLNNSHPIVAEFIKQSFIQDPQTAQIANLICDKSANPEASLNSIRDERSPQQ